MKKLLMMVFCLISLKPMLHGEIKEGAYLEAKIELIPTQPAGNENVPIIQPGSPIIISAQLTNTGTKSNAPGYFFVRFAYPNPLASQARSQLFVTEKVTLPSIAPGKNATIDFKTTHQTPSLYDFVRQDFGMRQYQAIVVIDSKEYLIGNASLTFSAYYYEGPTHEMPTQVPTVINLQNMPQRVEALPVN